MPWVLPKPSESGYELGNRNFWNQMQSTIQLMQGVISTLPALYKALVEARAIGDNAAANAIILRINELAASLPRTPLGTVPTTAGQLAAHQNLARRGFVGRDVYWRYLTDLFERRIPYSQVFPRPISQEDDPNVINVGGVMVTPEFLEWLRILPEIIRAERMMQSEEAFERALEELPPDARGGVRRAVPRRRQPDATERLEGVNPSGRSGARIMRSLSGDERRRQGSVSVGGTRFGPDFIGFFGEELPGRTLGHRVPGASSPAEAQYLMWLREQLRRWREEP